jgi:hypothetical protein
MRKGVGRVRAILSRRGSIATAALSLCLVGCAANRRSRSEQRIAVATVERDQLCDEDVEREAASVLRAVQSAEPLYVRVRLGKSYDTRLLGAQLWLPARPGWTPQWLERTLRCHQARRALQPASAQPASDPFWLPDSWVDIEVLPERAGFIAVLRVNRVVDGQQVYARARDFVAKPTSER